MATIFENESSVLENASMMVDACREEYERAGMPEVAASLFGLEVTTLASARLALLTVTALPIIDNTEAVRRCALGAINAAIRAWLPQRAVS